MHACVHRHACVCVLVWVVSRLDENIRIYGLYLSNNNLTILKKNKQETWWTNSFKILKHAFAYIQLKYVLIVETDNMTHW